MLLFLFLYLLFQLIVDFFESNLENFSKSVGNINNINKLFYFYIVEFVIQKLYFKECFF
jgi:hypothetical protein